MVGGSVGDGDGSMTEASTGNGDGPMGKIPNGVMPSVVADGVAVAVKAVTIGPGGVGLPVGLGVGAGVVFGVGLGVGFGVGGGVASAGALMVTVPAVKVASLLSLATALTTTACRPAGSLPDQPKVTPLPHDPPGVRAIS